MIWVFWAFSGWCGTPYPWSFWHKHPPDPDPPEPWWLVKIVSIIGGIAGGWMTQQIIGHADVSGITVLAEIAGSFVTGGFLGGAVRLIAGGRAK